MSTLVDSRSDPNCGCVALGRTVIRAAWSASRGDGQRSSSKSEVKGRAAAAAAALGQLGKAAKETVSDLR